MFLILSLSKGFYQNIEMCLNLFVKKEDLVELIGNMLLENAKFRLH